MEKIKLYGEDMCSYNIAQKVNEIIDKLNEREENAESSEGKLPLCGVSVSLFYQKVEKLVDEWKATNLGEVTPYSPESEIDAGFRSFLRWLKKNDNDR